MRIEIAPFQPLTRQLKKIALNGGITPDLYKGVSKWRDATISNGGKPLKDFYETTPDDMVKNIIPLLEGVDNAQNKLPRAKAHGILFSFSNYAASPV